MKKKFISVIALSSILGMGVVSLASCQPKEVIKEIEVEKPINYYGVSLNSTNDVKLTSETVNAKVGDTVRVKVELLNQAYGVAGLTVTGNVEATKVKSDELIYEFKMPETSVTVNAVLKSKDFNITVVDEDAKGKLRVYDVNNKEVKKAKAGQQLLAIYESIDINYMPLKLMANEDEISYDSDLLGYSFNMPAKDLTLTLTYKEAAYQLYSESPFAFTSTDASWDDTSLIYNLKTADGTVLTESGFGMNTFEKVKPGEKIIIEVLEDTYKLENRKELLGATINGQEITLNKTTDPLKYTFNEFSMPARDSVLSFKFDQTEYHSIRYKKPAGIDVETYNPFSEETQVNPIKIKDNAFVDFKVKANGKVLDEKESGIFDLYTDKKIGTFSKDENGNMSAVVRSITGPIVVVIKDVNPLLSKGLLGDFVAIDSISNTGNTKNSLKIKEDYTFEFITASAANDKKVGTLKESGTSYVAVEENIDFTLTPVYEKDELVMILVRYKPTPTRNPQYYAFTKNTFTTVDADTTLNGAHVAHIVIDHTSHSYWVYADDDKIEVITFKNFESEFDTETVYEIKTSTFESKVKYDGSKLILPGEEVGTFKGEGGDIILDGFGAYARKTSTGSYTFDSLNSIVNLKNIGKFTLDLEAKTYKAYNEIDTLVTGLSYAFKTKDVEFTSGKDVTLTFGKSSVVTLTATDKKAVSYSIKDTTITLRLDNGNDVIFTFDKVTGALKVTSGFIYIEDDLKDLTISLTSIESTFTGTEDLVLKADKSYTKGTTNGTYELSVEKSDLIIKTNDKKGFKLNLESKTYEEYALESADFFAGNSYKIKYEYEEYMSDTGMASTEGTLTFAASGTTTFTLTLKQYYGMEEMASHTTTNGNYVFDEAKNTITLTLTGTTSTITIKVDPTAKTLKFGQTSIKTADGEFVLDYSKLTKK